MKHNLLSLIALTGAMLMSTSASAQTELADPVRPARPQVAFTGQWVTPQTGGKYYMYNVGAGLFLGGGQTWGTRGIVLADSVVTLNQPAVQINSKSDNTTANYVLPFELIEEDAENNVWAINTLQNSKASSNAGSFVGEDGAQAWIDGGADRKSNFGAWQFIQVEGGYQIANVYVNDTKFADMDEVRFGVDGNNLAGANWAHTWTDLYVELPEDNNTLPWIVWQFVSADDSLAVRQYCKDYNLLVPAYEAELNRYNALVSLKKTINEAEEAGVDASETEAAIAVYKNPNATPEDIQKQQSHLLAMIAGLQYDFTGASDDSPLDVTEQVLKNPNFDNNINDWTITVGGQNLQWQNRVDGKIDEAKNWVQIDRFIEAWTSNTGALRDGTISQTVYGLPKGKYVLECDAMATRQGGLNGKDPEEAVEGAYIFIQGEQSEVRNAIKAPDAQPKHWSVVFISDGSDWLTFGLKVENTTANWISADNFRLWYYGETTMSQAQLELDKIVKEAEALQESDNFDDNCYAPTREEFESKLAAAQDMLEGSASDEDLQAAGTALSEAKTALLTSQAAYATLKAFYTTTLPLYVREAAVCCSDEIAEEFEEALESLEEAYDEGSMPDSEINTKIAEFLPKLKANLDPNKIPAGHDLTWLMTNPGFDTSLDGWTISDGSATPAIANGLAEVYQAKFDIHQIIKDMPAGAYEISLQGFTRNQPGGKRMAFTPEEQAGTTFAIYTPTNAANIQNILAGASTELIAQRGEETEPENYILVDGGIAYDIAAEIDGVVYYMPNGMPSARQHFDLGHYKTSVTVVNGETGDLDIGIRCTTTQEWCLWDELTLTFKGVDLQSYIAMINEKRQELLAAYEDAQTEHVTAKGEEIYQKAKKDADEKVQQMATTDDFSALYNEITSAIAYLKEGKETAGQIKDLAEEYEIRLGNTFFEKAPQDANGFQDYIDELKGNLETSGSIADNEALKALPEEINTRWTKYVMEFVEENPYSKDDMSNFGNATEAIYNPRFTSYLTESEYTNAGWTYEIPDTISGGFNAGAGVGEVYNTPGYQVSQNIKGLTKGYYLVTMDGFYRPGFPGDIKSDSLAHVQNVDMFGYTSVNKYGKAVMNVMDNAQTEKLGSGDESEVTIDGAVSNIPNNVTAAFAYVTLEDQEAELTPTPAYDLLVFTNSIYRNDLIVEVGEDGELTIGLKNYAQLNGDWTIFTNWTLTYLGTEVPDGIQSTEAKKANGMANIYTIDGRQAQKLQRGINIVRMADGSVQKVLVK